MSNRDPENARRFPNPVASALRCPVHVSSRSDERSRTGLRMTVACFAASELGCRLDTDRLYEEIEKRWPLGYREHPRPILNLRPLLKSWVEGRELAPELLAVPVANLRHLLGTHGVDLIARSDVETSPEARARIQQAARATLQRQPETPPPARATRPGRLTKHLLARGLIDQVQLDAALATQRHAGGRIGHHLVLHGSLSDEALARALSVLSGRPGTARLPPPSLVARAEFPPALLHEVLMLPIERRMNTVRVAVADPAEPRLMSLGEDRDLRIQTVVCPEHVLERARARYLGIPRPERLLVTPNSEGWAADDTVETRASAPWPDRVDLATYASAFLDCRTEDDVGRRAFELWSREFGRAVCLTVQDKSFAAVRLHGYGPELASTVQHLRIPIGLHGPLLEAVRDRKPHFGAIYGVAQTDVVVQRLGLSSAHPVAILPLQEPAGAVRGILIGTEPRGPQGEGRLNLLRASFRAAMRLVQAQQALLQLREFARRPRP